MVAKPPPTRRLRAVYSFGRSSWTNRTKSLSAPELVCICEGVRSRCSLMNAGETLSRGHNSAVLQNPEHQILFVRLSIMARSPDTVILHGFGADQQSRRASGGECACELYIITSRTVPDSQSLPWLFPACVELTSIERAHGHCVPRKL